MEEEKVEACSMNGGNEKELDNLQAQQGHQVQTGEEVSLVVTLGYEEQVV